MKTKFERNIEALDRHKVLFSEEEREFIKDFDLYRKAYTFINSKRPKMGNCDGCSEVIPDKPLIGRQLECGRYDARPQKTHVPLFVYFQKTMDEYGNISIANKDCGAYCKSCFLVILKKISSERGEEV